MLAENQNNGNKFDSRRNDALSIRGEVKKTVDHEFLDLFLHLSEDLSNLSRVFYQQKRA